MPQQRLYFLPLPQGQGAFFEGSCCVWVGMSLRMVGLIERHCTQDKRVHATVPEIAPHIDDCVEPADNWPGCVWPYDSETCLCRKGNDVLLEGGGEFFSGINDAA
jgi:hypothetical protein